MFSRLTVEFCWSHEVMCWLSWSHSQMSSYVDLTKLRANYLVLTVKCRVMLITRSYVLIILFSRWLSECIDLWDWDVNYLNLMKLRIIYLALTEYHQCCVIEIICREPSWSHEVSQCGWTRNVIDIDFVDHEVDQQNSWWNGSRKLIEMKEKWIS